MDQSAKQLAVESIKQATNVLVTVSANPSVDQLSAAIGLTLMLSKLEKHATAVFSGQVPAAIKFLDPSKTLEDNVDSLRDFIIALDKEKADKLRYKVEDNVVRIFITPYKTKISQEDFQFSQGDFNVDVVVALGVESREDLDNAIKAHGRILHDSSVVTVNTGKKQSKLGAVNWSDDSASSLCEMLVSVSESFGSGLLDQQISTAYLTGIVAATERFSNNKTSPKVMTMSAQLMAAGANQQLIATELQIGVNPLPEQAVALKKAPDVVPQQQVNEIDLKHNEEVSSKEVSAATEVVIAKEAVVTDEVNKMPVEPLAKTTEADKSLRAVEDEIAALSGNITTEPSAPPVATPLPAPVFNAPPEPNPTTEELSLPPVQGLPPVPAEHSSPGLPPLPTSINDVKSQNPILTQDAKPVMGGTFNATSSEAHDITEQQRLDDSGGAILNHAGPAGNDPAADTSPTVHAPTIEPKHGYLDPAAAPVDENTGDLDAARNAVENAMNAQPFDPANHPNANFGSQPMPTESESQEIKIDNNGMVSHPSAVPGTPAEDPQAPTIL